MLFTSESVTEGHPDKMADQISDAVLDDILEHDPKGRVACETFIKTGLVVVGGEITTEHYVDIPKIVRGVIKDIGYNSSDIGFDYNTCGVVTTIDQQSPDIARGVDKESQGAGDQGMMFGYACNETEDYMPAPIYYAHKLCKQLADFRKEDINWWLRPDGKSQVTVEYGDTGYIQRIDTIVVSTQHSPDISLENLSRSVKEYVIEKVIPENLIDKRTKIFVNPTGRFVEGGPKADTGLTGRKIIVDTYGGMGRHGGGAFSGKDPSKVDRSAAYMARHVAKSIVANKLADKCELQIAYAIGVAEPVSININTFGTHVKHYDNSTLEGIVNDYFDFRPAAIIEYLDLLRPFYRETATYGHFGRKCGVKECYPTFPWEKIKEI